MGKDIISLDHEVAKWAWKKLATEKMCPVIILKRIYKLKISLEDVSLEQDLLDLSISENPSTGMTPGAGPAQPASEQSAAISPDAEREGRREDADVTVEHALGESSTAATAVADDAKMLDRRSTDVSRGDEFVTSTLSGASKSAKPTKKISFSTKYSKSETTVSTTFDNSTEQEQKYTFRVEKTTKDIFRVSVTKGVSLGGTLVLNAKVPTMVEVGATIKLEVQVSKTNEHVVENEAKWCGEGEITAPSKTSSSAYVKTTSLNLSKEFRLHTAVRGTVVASVIRRKGNVICCIYNDDVERIFKNKRQVIDYNFEGSYKYYQVLQTIVIAQKRLLTA